MANWWFYRGTFPWGTCDGYTNGTRFGFIERAGRRNRKRFYTPARMANRLERDWRPPHNWQNLGMVASTFERTIAELRSMP